MLIENSHWKVYFALCCSILKQSMHALHLTGSLLVLLFSFFCLFLCLTLVANQQAEKSKSTFLRVDAYERIKKQRNTVQSEKVH